MKPTITQIKEYFKNAKKVKSLSGRFFIIKDINSITLSDYDNCFYYNHGKYEIYNSINNKYAEIISYKDELIGKAEQLQTPNHYDNSKGTLYKVATERNWNPYLFDIVKRLERAEKKGEFKTDLEKSINVIKLWLNESE
jgi:hypothetical protein